MLGARVIAVAVGYCFGLFQTGYIYGEKHGVDIRTQGSGNAGTTNTLRVLGLRAVVSLTFDGSFAVHDIKIVQGEERLFVAMPSRRDDNGVFRDIVHPIDSELRNEIEGEILSAYRMELDRQAAEQQDLS